MAKKKKKTTTRRRRRVSGTMSGGVSLVVGAVLGGVAGKLANKMLDGKLNGYITNGVLVAGGFMVPKFVKGTLGMGIACGMAASGGIGMLNKFGVLNGIGELGEGGGDYSMEFISGTDGLKVISNTGDDDGTDFGYNGLSGLNVIAGIENELEDYSAYMPPL